MILDWLSLLMEAVWRDCDSVSQMLNVFLGAITVLEVLVSMLSKAATDFRVEVGACLAV